MELRIEIPDYDRKKGFHFKWTEGFEIEVKTTRDGGAMITANKEGLESLANHLLNLAQKNIPTDYHIHFSMYDSLEDDSIELTIQKK